MDKVKVVRVDNPLGYEEIDRKDMLPTDVEWVDDGTLLPGQKPTMKTGVNPAQGTVQSPDVKKGQVPPKDKGGRK